MLLPNHAVNIQNCTLSVMLLPNHAFNIQTAHCLLCCCQDKQLHIKHCLSDFAMPSVWFHGPVAHKPRARIHTAAHIHILYPQPYPYPISNSQAHLEPRSFTKSSSFQSTYHTIIVPIPSVDRGTAAFRHFPWGTRQTIWRQPDWSQGPENVFAIYHCDLSLQFILSIYPCNLSCNSSLQFLHRHVLSHKHLSHVLSVKLNFPFQQIITDYYSTGVAIPANFPATINANIPAQYSWQPGKVVYASVITRNSQPS